MYTLKLSDPELQQLTCDLEQAAEETATLSRRVKWYVTDIPERLVRLLAIIRERAEPDEREIELRKRVAAQLVRPHSEAFKGLGKKSK